MHSVKKFNRNFEAVAATSDVPAVAVETDSVLAKDEFWDYEKQVSKFGNLYIGVCRNCSEWDCVSTVLSV